MLSQSRLYRFHSINNNKFFVVTAIGHNHCYLMESDNYKVDTKKAELFHSYYKAGKLTDTAIVQIISGEKTRKPKSSKPQPVKIKPAVISKYFTAQQTQKEIEEVIDKALALYFENQESEVTA